MQKYAGIVIIATVYARIDVSSRLSSWKELQINRPRQKEVTAVAAASRPRAPTAAMLETR
ncbi:hypothetical protein VFPPC_00162 [Pochonia chlamydosporia 170]|uniref:Uncharacterized protein n=1 Tax=Pochonia chlamydosporia 170 TaxID=1380566 RepID=A0A179G2N0_METCM|nr:hypothetical protein VFPPC_00162 [Pochonia chlamydosporia 170]OAQ72114.2 hypothetical protein VFPPC_00162 [Pochonia chlamydosporia 170]